MFALDLYYVFRTLFGLYIVEASFWIMCC